MHLIQVLTLPLRIHHQPSTILGITVIPKPTSIRPQRQPVAAVLPNLALVPSLLALHGLALIDGNRVLEPPVGSREDHFEADAAVPEPEVAELPARVEDGRQGAAVAAGGRGRVLEGVGAEGRDRTEGAVYVKAGGRGGAVGVGYVLGGELVVAD